MSKNSSLHDFIDLEDRYQIRSYKRWPITLVRGEKCRVWDDRGVEYLDLYGGHCVALIGHSHPVWVTAIAEQAARLGFYSNVAGNDTRALYQKQLIDFAPEHLRRVFLCNSGTEANETAVKVALKATGRTQVIGMEGSFHGRTAGSLSLTNLGSYRLQFPTVVRPCPIAPFGDLEGLAALLDETIAAVILEPVQSMNGVRSAQPDYYQGLVRMCHDNGTLVIMDEIQTGMGRLGASFAADFYGAEADLITAAKGIANGFPMAAVLATEAVADTVKIGEQGTTFGGGPLACAAGSAVLQVIEEERLVERAARLGEQARRLLIRGPIQAIRGEGLLLGLESCVPAADLAGYLLQNKILTGTSSDPHVLRLMPPLVVEQGDLEILGEALDRFPG